MCDVIPEQRNQVRLCRVHRLEKLRHACKSFRVLRKMEIAQHGDPQPREGRIIQGEGHVVPLGGQIRLNFEAKASKQQ